MQGKVKWFSNEKGYGFIVGSNEVNHYFRVQDIQGITLPLNGDVVSFESSEGTKGPRATSIVIERRNQADSTAQKGNDRVTCPTCNKKMIPRIVVHRGVAQKSLCPFCGNVVMYFNMPTYNYAKSTGNSIVSKIARVILFIIVLIIFYMSIYLISGAGWALLWTPFLAIGLWSMIF